MIILFVVSNLVEAKIELNQASPPSLLVDDARGLDGGVWFGSELKGVVHILMYVDPSKVKTNDHVE